MKRNILFIIILMLIAHVVHANDGLVILQSKGKVTFFDSDKVNDAITAAVEGDTIDLAASNIRKDISINLNKNILLRGRGADLNAPYTYIWDISISSPCTIEGIYVESNINVTKSVTGLSIRSCSFSEISFARDMPGMTIERSQCRNNMFLDNLRSKDINIKNCNINKVYGGSGDSRPCTFRNCNIANVNNGDTNIDKLINCIVESFDYYYYGSFGGCLNANVAINCLWHVDCCGVATRTNIYQFDNPETGNFLFSNSSEAVSVYSKDQLIEKGCLGTDGTVVGSQGGACPFSLIPINTRIVSGNITMDESTRKISAEVEVKVE